MDLYVLRIRATFALSSRAEGPLDCTNLVVRSIRKWPLPGDSPGAFVDSAIGAESCKCSRILLHIKLKINIFTPNSKMILKRIILKRAKIRISSGGSPGFVPGLFV